MSIRYILQLVGVFFYVMGSFPLLWAQEEEKVKLEYRFKPGDETFYRGEFEIEVTGGQFPSFACSLPFTISKKILKVNPDGSAWAYFRMRILFEKLHLYKGDRRDLQKIYNFLVSSFLLPEFFSVGILTKSGNPYYAGKLYSETAFTELPPEPLAPGEKISRVESFNGSLVKNTWELRDVRIKDGNKIAVFNLLREIDRKNYGASTESNSSFSCDVEFDMNSSTILSVSAICKSEVVTRISSGHENLNFAENRSHSIIKAKYKKVESRNVDDYTRWGEVPDIFLNPGKKWTVGYTANYRLNRVFIEYVPKGEDVYNWSEMLTISITPKFSQGVIKPEDVLKNMFTTLRQKCPEFGYNILKRNSNSVIYECFFPRKCLEPRFNFSECDVGRIIIGKERIHVIIYATKDIPVSPEWKEKVVDVLKHIKLSNE